VPEEIGEILVEPVDLYTRSITPFGERRRGLRTSFVKRDICSAHQLTTREGWARAARCDRGGWC
jgi:hypothetical protein